MNNLSCLGSYADMVEKKLEELALLARDDMERYGEYQPETCRKVNALYLAIDRACDELIKGMKGEF